MSWVFDGTVSAEMAAASHTLDPGFVVRVSANE
jgi:hypothetical protein